MDKLKKIFSGGADKETTEAKNYGRKSIDSEARGNTGTSTGLGSSTAGDSSSYETRAGTGGLASSAEKELTSGTTGSSSTTRDINRPFAKDDLASSSGAGTSPYATDTTEGYGATSGNTLHSDAATTTSIKSGVQGTDLTGVPGSAQTTQPTSAEYGSSGSGLTGTAFADRSVGTTGSDTYTQTSTHGGESGVRAAGGPHPTFTGNRLDPVAVEEIPTYHTEVADAHKHHSTGAPALGPTGMAATYVLSGAEADQYQGASSISTFGYGSGSGSQSYGTTDTLGSGQTQTYDRSSTGPAPNTIGHHSSDFMNVIDPRVQPEPALMKGEQSSSRDYGSGTGAATYGSEKPSAVRRYEEDRGTSEGQSYARTGATAGAAGVDSSEYPVLQDLEQHQAIEDRDRKQSKGGPLGILHSSQRDKYDDPTGRETSAKEKYFGQHARSSGEQDRSVASSSHFGRDAAGVGAAGGLGTAAAYEYEKHSQTSRGTGEYDPYSTASTTTALPTTGAISTTTTTGVYDPYAKEATTGPTGFAVGQTGTSGATSSTYTRPVAAAAAPVAAATTTTAVPEKKHTFGFLHRKDPNKLHKDPPSSRGVDDAGDGRVIDSITGLPMNVAKYGSGAGGIDGNKAVHGYEAGLNRERLATEGTADYEAIQKANVPY